MIVQFVMSTPRLTVSQERLHRYVTEWLVFQCRLCAVLRQLDVCAFKATPIRIRAVPALGAKKQFH